MSKELEARKTLNKYRNSWYNEVDKEKVEVANALDVLLPFPTAEEVCEALSEWFGKKVFYEQKRFYVEQVLIETQSVAKLDEYGTVIFSMYFAFSPHLITMIGRFYEGVIENE